MDMINEGAITDTLHVLLTAYLPSDSLHEYVSINPALPKSPGFSFYSARS